jgi:hypothetical protein
MTPTPANYALGLAFTGTGTAAVSNGSNAVAGASTLFVSEFQIGDVIIINGEVKLVANVSNNTNLTTTTDFAATASGLAITGSNLIALQNLTLLVAGGITPPKGNFMLYTQPLDLGDGSLRGGGWPTDEWKWVFLPRAQRDPLRGAFFSTDTIPASPVVSKRLYIRTSVTEAADQYRVYRAWALWPQKEDRQATRRLSFSIRFRAMELVT